MGGALQISFFLPLPLPGAGINNDRAPGRATPQLLDRPNPLDGRQLDIQDAGLDEREQLDRAAKKIQLLVAQAGQLGVPVLVAGTEQE